MNDNAWIIYILNLLIEKKNNMDVIKIGMENQTYYEITKIINSLYKIAKDVS